MTNKEIIQKLHNESIYTIDVIEWLVDVVEKEFHATDIFEASEAIIKYSRSTAISINDTIRHLRTLKKFSAGTDYTGTESK